MSERLCIFCTRFRWENETQWGMGSTQTGPLMEGGFAECRAGHKWEISYPQDQDDWRRIIVAAATCQDYDEVTT